MKSDITTKVLLLVIAIALIANLFKVSAQPAHALNTPTSATVTETTPFQVTLDAEHAVIFISDFKTRTVYIQGYEKDGNGGAEFNSNGNTYKSFQIPARK
jgi:hypothetical protein